MSDTFCVLPWVHLATHPNGGATLCCVSDHRGSINSSFDRVGSDQMFRTIHTHTIHDIMNSESFRETRVQMLAGAKPAPCTRCYAEEATHVQSKRQYENTRHGLTPEQARAITTDDGTLVEVDLKFLELRMGNLCNLKCRTCNPWSSSKWVGEWTHHGGFFNASTSDFQWPEKIDFWKDLYAHSANTNRIYINGGEPTMVEEHYDFLSALIYSGRSDKIDLTYNLNMTAIPDRLLKIWAHFRHVRVSASIDDLDERNTYIRHPVKWATVQKSLDRLQQAGIDTDITQTVSWMNFPYLDEFAKWARSRSLKVNHNFVYDPAYYSPLVLPLEYRRSVVDTFQTLTLDKIETLQSMFCTQPDNKLLQDQAYAFTVKLDDYRGEKFASVFPDLYKIWKNIDGNYFP